ncbi:MAG: hypothetical protein V3575_00600 [Candidatus Absconditabacteria bacterium]
MYNSGEMMNNGDNLNETTKEGVLSSLKQELNFIKESLTQSEVDKSKIKYNILDLMNKVKSISFVDQKEIQTIIDSIENGVDVVSIDKILNLLNDFQHKENELSTVEISSLKNSLNVFKSSKNELHDLKLNTLIDQKKKEIRDKIQLASKGFMRGMFTPVVLMVFDSLDKKVGESAGSKEVGFFDNIINSIKEFFGKMIIDIIPGGKKMMEMYEKLISKDSSIVQEIKDNGGKMLENLKDQIDVAQMMETAKAKLKLQFSEYLKEKLGKDIPQDKVDGFFDKFFKDNYNKLKDMQIYKFYESEKGGENSSYTPLIDGFMDTLKVGGLTIKFIASMVDSGIIDYGDIMTETTNEITKYGVMSFNIIKDSISVISTEMTLDDLKNNIENINLSETEKQLLTIMIYRKGGLFFDFLGNVAYGVTKASTYFIAYAGQDMSQFGARWNSFFGNYDKQLDLIEGIARKINPSIDSQSMNYLKGGIQEMKDFCKFWSWYQTGEKAWKQSGKTFVDFMKSQTPEIQNAAKSILNNNLNEITDSKALRSVTSTKLTTIGSNLEKYVDDTIACIGGQFKGGLSEVHVFNRFGKEINRAGNAFAEIVRADDLLGTKKLFNLFRDKIRLGDSLSKQIGLSDDLFLAFESVDDLKKWSSEAQILMRKFPEGAKMLFQKMPIIAVAGLELSKDDASLPGLMSSLFTLVPFVGGFQLIGSSQFVKTEDGLGFKFEGDITSSAIGVGLMWFDTFIIGKALLKDGLKGVGRELIRPAVDIWELGTMSSRGLLYSGKFAKDTVHVFSKSGLLESGKFVGSGIANGLKGIDYRKLIKNPRFAALVIISVLGVAAAEYSGVFDSETEKHIKDLLANQDGGNYENIQKELLDNWAKLDDGEKNDAIKLILNLRAKLSGITIASKAVYRDDINIDCNNITIGLDKFVAVDNMINFKIDTVDRLSRFGLVSQNTKIYYEINGKKALQDYLSTAQLESAGYKVDYSKSIEEYTVAEIGGLNNLLNYLNNLGYDNYFDPNSGETINLTKNILENIGFDINIVNNYPKLVTLIAEKGYIYEGFEEDVANIMNLDMKLAGDFSLAIKEYYLIRNSA